MTGPVDVFRSYALADEDLRGELEKHLAGLQRDGVLRTWSTRRTAAGDDWKKATEAHLSGAGLVLLLVSADYLASDDLYEVQAMTALARARAGDARVIPVLLHACDWTLGPFAGLVPLPPNRKPVSSWENRHEAWTAVARGIREAITGATAPVVAPEPAYESAEIRALAEQIESARLRRAALAEAGASTAATDGEILQMRRRLREGGQLRAGDALGEGRYLLLHPLGHGGFGAVWAAFDRTHGEQVAIKVLHPSQARDASRRERFFRGARVMGSLRHEGVVRVLDPRGEDGGYLYFVMELVAGKDLHRTVIEKRLAPDDAMPLILCVAEALGEAHAQGLVHRDVKPANIVLDASGRPKLTDFDLVAAKDTTGGTRTGALGTFLFTAPEQMNNAKEADARADVFGLGMTALFCLHGKELPAIVTRKPERVIAALACSEAVKEVLTRAIELEPENRYTDARAFCEALRAVAMPVAMPAPPPAPSVAPPPLPSPPPSVPPPVAEAPASALRLQTPYRVELARKEQEAVAREDARPVPSSDKRSPAKVAAMVAGAVAAMLGVATMVRATVTRPPDVAADASPTATTTATQVSVPVETATAVATAAADAGGPCPPHMLLVPAGTFTMGSADGDSDEKPLHSVKLSAFCIDRTEVTVADYQRCTNCGPAEGSEGCNWGRSDRENHPINCVSWTQADAYCRSVGGYLPTEAQWEYAARGPKGRKYPWGDTPPSNQLCWDGEGNDLGRGNRYGTCVVDGYSDGASPFGALNMAGNVWEWVADWYAPYPAERKTIPEDPKGPRWSPESRRVIRGGGWSGSDASGVRAAVRSRDDVSNHALNIGFRCARGQEL